MMFITVGKIFVLEEDKIIFKRATFASVITSAYPMIVVGCYFGITPWNMNRLSIDETDLSMNYKMIEEAKTSHADALQNCKQLITSVQNPILLKYTS